MNATWSLMMWCSDCNNTVIRGDCPKNCRKQPARDIRRRRWASDNVLAVPIPRGMTRDEKDCG